MCIRDSGKDECWLILGAEPNAELGLGLKAPADVAALRAAAQDGSIVDMVDWRPAHAGEFFYNAAGTIHAIGGGLTLVEVQQNSDCTYRLFDYGRPRDLHLDDGLAAVSYTHLDVYKRQQLARSRPNCKPAILSSSNRHRPSARPKRSPR